MNLQQPPPMDFTTSNLADSWEKFKKGFTTYADAVDLGSKPESQRIGILLHCIGYKGMEIFYTLKFNPASNKTKYAEVLKKYEEEFCPKKNVTYERFRFNSCEQTQGQCIEDYISELRKLASSCNYGDLEPELIMDRLVCGIRSDTLRERLLRTTELSLDKAINACKTAEMVEVQLRSMNEGSESVQNIDNVKVAETKRASILNDCKFCGRSHTYGKSHCPAAEKQCNNCGKKGHFAHKCYQKKSAAKTHENQSYTNNKKFLSQQVDNLWRESDEDATIFSLVKFVLSMSETTTQPIGQKHC